MMIINKRWPSKSNISLLLSPHFICHNYRCAPEKFLQDNQICNYSDFKAFVSRRTVLFMFNGPWALSVKDYEEGKQYIRQPYIVWASTCVSNHPLWLIVAGLLWRGLMYHFLTFSRQHCVLLINLLRNFFFLNLDTDSKAPNWTSIFFGFLQSSA